MNVREACEIVLGDPLDVIMTKCLRCGGPDWVSLRPSGACSEGDYRDADGSRTHDALPLCPPSTKR